ncbi:MAG: Ig-like domain-containing protein [Propionibacteriaceae bacterium]|jgi:hypothetical protein|nr:Ig-like domain-containing protein [Propionibacteriaceae bacterium]
MNARRLAALTAITALAASANTAATPASADASWCDLPATKVLASLDALAAEPGGTASAPAVYEVTKLRQTITVPVDLKPYTVLRGTGKQSMRIRPSLPLDHMMSLSSGSHLCGDITLERLPTSGSPQPKVGLAINDAQGFYVETLSARDATDTGTTVNNSSGTFTKLVSHTSGVGAAITNSQVTAQIISMNTSIGDGLVATSSTITGAFHAYELGGTALKALSGSSLSLSVAGYDSSYAIASGADGLVVDGGSKVVGAAFEASANKGNGVVVRGGGSVQFDSLATTGPEDAVVPRGGNGGAGVVVDGGQLSVENDATISGNGGDGLSVANGWAGFGTLTLADNGGYGVTALAGGRAAASACITYANNTAGNIRTDGNGSVADPCGTTPPPETPPAPTPLPSQPATTLPGFGKLPAPLATAKANTWVKRVKAAQKTLNLVAGQTAKVPVRAYPNIGDWDSKKAAVTYRSSNPSVVKVSKTGKLTALAKGRAVIKATAVTKGKSGQTMTASVKVTVVAKPVKTTAAWASGVPKTMRVDDRNLVWGHYSPPTATGAVTKFKTSNPKTLSVGSTGVLVAHKTGTAKLTITANNHKHTYTIKILPKKK